MLSVPSFGITASKKCRRVKMVATRRKLGNSHWPKFARFCAINVRVDLRDNGLLRPNVTVPTPNEYRSACL